MEVWERERIVARELEGVIRAPTEDADEIEDEAASERTRPRDEVMESIEAMGKSSKAVWGGRPSWLSALRLIFLGHVWLCQRNWRCGGAVWYNSAGDHVRFVVVES